jgi:hypothetical protein
VDVAGVEGRARPAPANVGAQPAGPGLAAQRADLEQVGRRDVDVRERMVGRDEAVVAPPQLDLLPRDLVAERRAASAGRSPPASSPRSSPSGRLPGRGRLDERPGDQPAARSAHASAFARISTARRSRRRLAGELGRRPERRNGDRVAAAGLDRLGQQVEVVPAQGR